MGVALKLAAVVALLSLVARSGAIDWRAIGGTLLDPVVIGANVVALGAMTLLLALRWTLLLRVQGVPARPGRVIAILLYAAFFSLFLPGSAGGDALRAWLIAGESRSRRLVAALTVAADRVVGLVSMVALPAGLVLAGPAWLVARPETAPLRLVLCAATGLAVALASLFFSRAGKAFVARARAVGSGKLARLAPLVDMLDAYRRRPGALASGTVLSMLSTGVNVVLFWAVGTRLGVGLSLSHFALIVPLAAIATYLSFLPFGLGAGQVAFYTLFAWTGSDPAAGVTLITVTQACSVAFHALFGAASYLAFKRAPASESPSRAEAA